MREMVEIYVNRKNGKVELTEIGESNLATQFMFKIVGEDSFDGFHCGKDEIHEVFEKFKTKEIKERKKEINNLQKEVSRLEKIKLPILIQK